MDNRIVAALGAIVVASSLGCAPGKATIKSVKREGYAEKLGKTLVVLEIPRLQADLQKAFKASLQKEMALRGAEVRYAVVSDELSVEKAPDFKKQAEDFGANAVLAILPNGGTVNQYGGLMAAKIDAQLHDLKLGKMVWRATVDYVPGSAEVPVDFRAEIISYEFITALVSDGVLKGPLPAKPERAPPPPNPNSQIH